MIKQHPKSFLSNFWGAVVMGRKLMSGGVNHLPIIRLCG